MLERYSKEYEQLYEAIIAMQQWQWLNIRNHYFPECTNAEITPDMVIAKIRENGSAHHCANGYLIYGKGLHFNIVVLREDRDD